MNQEIELKLELPEEAADSFGKSDFLPDEGGEAELRAIYFDTPDRQLLAHGLSLRIRRSGKERVQTVKADRGERGAGLFARAEWEMPVKGDVPVIDIRTPVAAILGESVEAVAPAFHVDIDRRTWLLSEGSATIEVVLDKGLVHADERQAPVCEIELEMKAGEPAALFSLARRIDAAVPVRLGVLAKAERGYRLLEAARAAFKAEPVGLAPTLRTGEAFQAVVRACVRHYRLNEALLLDHYEPSALHQARVAIRRLRSALSLFKPILAQEDVDRFQGELRWLAGGLGDARNLDVLIERTKPGPLHDRIQTARSKVHADVLATLALARVRGLMIDLVEWLTLGAGPTEADGQALRDEPAGPFAADRLQHFFRRVVKGGRDMAELEDEARHEVRKNAKKLRYASEFFTGLFVEKKQRRRHAKFIDALEALQDDLGALNDLVGTPGLLAQYGLSGEEEAVKGGGRKKKLIAAAADAHEGLAEARRFWH